MSFKIVVDSCCDLTPSMLKDPVFVKVPLTISSNGSTFVDDETFDQADLLWSMRQSEDAPSTACPSPQAYLDAYQGAGDVYVVTLTALLSGSHNSAEQARILLEEEHPDVVVTAFDTSLDYKKMCRVCDHVRAGLPYLATHPDYNCPTENGFIPDAGAIHAFIHASAFRYPDRIIGKPNEDIIEYLATRVHTQRAQIAMVGDRLYTDIAAGRNNGLKSVLVLSGEATMEDVHKSDVLPHLIFQSVRELGEWL